MHDSVLAWAERIVDPAWVRDAHVLEVGSLDVNGSLRPLVTRYGPARYRGIDMRAGPGVDEVLAAEEMVDVETYDLIISTEMLEHCLPWAEALYRMKRALRIGGRIVLTTRGPGTAYHGFPDDYWRFTLDHATRMFSDFTTLALDDDPGMPGFLYAGRRRRASVLYPTFTPERPQ